MSAPGPPERRRRRRRAARPVRAAGATAAVGALTGTAPPWVHWLPAAAGALATPAGFALWRLDGRRAPTKARLLAELQRELALPSYFGGTWDALEDCLTDLSWRPAAGYRLVVEAADRLLADEPAARRVLLDLLESVGRAWATRATGHPDRAAVPFHTVLVGAGPAAPNAPGVTLPPPG